MSHEHNWPEPTAGPSSGSHPASSGSHPGRFDAFLFFIERSRKRLLVACGIALFLHLPLTPIVPVVRLAQRFARIDQARPPGVPSTPAQQIEIELRELVRQEQARQAAQQRAEPELGRSKDRASLSLDRNAAPNRLGIKLAQAQDSAEDKRSTEPTEPTAQRKRPMPRIGLKGKLAPELLGRPELSLLLWFSGLRQHPLASRVTELLRCDSEWRALFGLDLDPLRDFEAALVVGTDAHDPRTMTAAVEHRILPERLREVMDALVESSGDAGKWLGTEAARVRLGRRQRVLLPHSERLLLVAPETGWQALGKIEQPLRLPAAAGRVLVLVLRRPAVSLARLGLELPSELEELRLELYAYRDQSLDLRLELDHTSEARAEADTRRLSSRLSNFFADLWATTQMVSALLRTGSNPNTRRDRTPSLELSADGKTLYGTVHFSPAQVSESLELVSSFMCRRRKAAAPPTASAR